MLRECLRPGVQGIVAQYAVGNGLVEVNSDPLAG